MKVACTQRATIKTLKAESHCEGTISHINLDNSTFKCLYSAPTPGSKSSGFDKLFVPEPMAAGGWDEAAWAAAGLPTSEDMLLQLQIHSVG